MIFARAPACTQLCPPLPPSAPPCLQRTLEEDAKRGQQRGKLKLAPELVDEYNRIKQVGRAPFFSCFLLVFPYGLGARGFVLANRSSG